MRRIVPDPDLFKGSRLPPHKLARELEMIDRILVVNPSVAEAVWKDLKGPQSKRGRPGLSADQVLRVAIVRQLNGYSYEDLAFYLADSASNRRFCGFTCPEEVPTKWSLARNIRQISAETWEEIDRILMDFAGDERK